MKILLFTILIFINIESLKAQVTINHDSISCIISMDDEILPILIYYGKPDKIYIFDDYPWVKQYFYRSGLTIWAGIGNNVIYSCNVISNKYSTNKGVRVGESKEKVLKVYGNGMNIEDKIDDYLIYDRGYKDYEEVIFYKFESEGVYLYLWLLHFMSL